MISWQKDYKDTVDKHASASELQLKYAELQEESKLVRTFADEASHSWPWPTAYLLNAERLTDVVGSVFENRDLQPSARLEEAPGKACKGMRGFCEGTQ